LAEQAKILVEEAEENNADDKVWNETWIRWTTCSLCEQRYHGVVMHALGWACWKTYVGRPEGDWKLSLGCAMAQLGNGLAAGGHLEDALSVREAELSMERRLGASEANMLVVQGNLAGTYQMFGGHELAMRMKRDVYYGYVRLYGEEHRGTLITAFNFAVSLLTLEKVEEAKLLLRKSIPVTQRLLGESHDLTFRMRCTYAESLYSDNCATLEDLRESVTTLEDTERIARRVLGAGHPIVFVIEQELRKSREVLSARETPTSV